MNYLYGNKKRIPIFTAKKIPDGFKRAKENERIAQIIDRIGELYGDIGNHKMIQTIIYSEKCGVCTESLVLWKNIVAELSRVLPTYIGSEIEFDKASDFNGAKVNGEEIYKFFI